MNKYLIAIVLPGLATLVAGCGIGYNETLFFTKSNVGLNVDARPPTAEVSISRTEGAIPPSFEQGQTPPLIASFRSNESAMARLAFGVKSTFAGGDAAVALGQGPDGKKLTKPEPLCLSAKPAPQHHLGIDVSIPEKDAVKPLVFATDTTFGLKLGWSGMTAAAPDTVRLGFSRKEVAVAPVTGTDSVSCSLPLKPNTQGTYAVSMPAFIAVLDNDVKSTAKAQVDVKWQQYFATGAAAVSLANQKQIRQIMMQRTDAAAFATTTYDPAPDSNCVRDWVAKSKKNASALKTWWDKQDLPDGSDPADIDTKEYSKQRAEFIEYQKISCPT